MLSVVVGICLLISLGEAATYLYANETAGLREVPTNIPSHVTDISLNDNLISELKSGAFPFPACRTLYLNDNQISIIQNGSFSGLVDIGRLELSRNKLTELTPGMVDGLQNIQSLTIENNMIQHVVPRTFLGFKKLESLSLKSNKLTEVRNNMMKDLVSLKDIEINGNEISNVEPNAFKNCTKLKVLLLSYNLIPHVTRAMWNGLEESVDTIFLHHNQLTLLERDLFTGLKNLTWVSLHDNQLQSLPWDIFRPGDLPKEKPFQFSISGNPVHCNQTWCWAQQAEILGWIEWYWGGSKEKYKPECPNSAWDGIDLGCTVTACSSIKQELCTTICETADKKGELLPLLDCAYDTYDCRCVSEANCPPLNQTSCTKQCESSGQDGLLYQASECPNGTPSCRCQDKDDSGSTGLIIGLCIAAGLLLVIIFFVKRKAIAKYLSSKIEKRRIAHPDGTGSKNHQLESHGKEGSYKKAAAVASVPRPAIATPANQSPPVPPPRPEEYEQPYAYNPQKEPAHYYLTLTDSPVGYTNVGMGPEENEYLEAIPNNVYKNVEDGNNTDETYQPVENPIENNDDTEEVYENIG